MALEPSALEYGDAPRLSADRYAERWVSRFSR
jgi:hypothetical protein